MTHLAVWLTPGLLRPFGLALLHFLWQGAALAALAALVFSFSRNARLRYAVGVFLLLLMVAAPVATFQILRRTPGPSFTPAAPATSAILAPMPSLAPASSVQEPSAASASSGALVWLVEAWFLGVLLFSLRTFGGVVILERLRRKSVAPLSHSLLARCHQLQLAMGIERIVQYCQSAHVAAPAVVGWFRPIVMLPVSALTGLSDAQLQAVIAHELAHIKRYDAFVNLFQIAAESLLFYHPGVWWLSKRTRAERENCCDDAAVAVCGSPVEYARALTLMEESRQVPQLALAANGHPLASRIKRLLGAPVLESGLRSAGLSAALLCLAAAVFAGNAFFGVARSQAAAQSPGSGESSQARGSVIVVQAERPAQEKPDKSSAKSGAAPSPAPEPAQTPEPSPKQSYIDSLKAEGIDKVSLDDLIALKIQGVTAEYIRGIHAAGFKPSSEELIAMKVQGITGDYIRELTQAGLKTNIDELIGMKVQGITPDYVRQMKDLGLDTASDNLIGMKVQGITPEYVKEMRGLGLKIDPDNLIGMKVQGTTPDYVKQMHDLGLKTDSDDLIGMKVQGITPQYVQAIRATGLSPDTDGLIGMKVQGVTPEYIKALQSAGLKLDADDAIGAKVQGITPEFIEKARSHGFKDLDLDKLIALKHSGVLE
jgi:beta-lactamase regulating signal transducer with metallopeptidase domain